MSFFLVSTPPNRQDRVRVGKQFPFGNILLATTIFVAMLASAAQAQFQWSKRTASIINMDNELSIGMTLDTNGNCYVTGWFDGANDSQYQARKKDNETTRTLSASR
jgi:hypothetical protein